MASAAIRIELTWAMSELPPERSTARSSARVPAFGADEVRAARREFERRVMRASLIVVSVVLVSLVIVLLVWRLRLVLLLLVVSLFIAALLHPIVVFFERRGLRRGPATGVVFVIAVLIWSALVAVLVHPIINSATHLVNELPKLVQQAQQGKGQIGHLVARLHLLNFVKSRQANLQSIISKLGKPALSVGKSVVSGVVAVVTIFFLSFFFLLELPGILRAILQRMQPDRSERLHTVLADVGRAVVGYMLGNLATSLVAGLVLGVTLFVMGVPFPVVLAIWVALVDFLPLVGGLLAGVPTVVIAALHSLPAGIVTLVVFLVYQQIENHILNPIVMSRTVRLKALYVLLAVLLGAEIGNLVGSVFGGLVGALLSVPAASAIQVIARDLLAHRTGASLLGIGPEGSGVDARAVIESPNGAAPEAVGSSPASPVRRRGGLPGRWRTAGAAAPRRPRWPQQRLGSEPAPEEEDGSN